MWAENKCKRRKNEYEANEGVVEDSLLKAKGIIGN